MDQRYTVACLALAGLGMGAGLLAVAAPARAQAPPNPLSLLISHNLCLGWILDARTHPERTTVEVARLPKDVLVEIDVIALV